MAGEAKLSVEVEAKVQSAVSNFNLLADQIEKGGREITTTVAGVEKSFQLLNKTKFTFGENYVSASERLAREAARSAAVLGGSVKKGANEAAFALTNLGRVAQDAPFGFIGIQNNLNPLLESFQRLKAETGSTGSALKALVSGLTGPAGIGIALSLVTAGLVLYTQWQQRSKKVTEEATDANDKYIQSLGGITALTAEAVKEQGKEIAQLDLLYRATQNINLPLAERKKAIVGLKSEFPAYFKGLSDEAILAGRAAGEYAKLKTELLAVGVARAAEKEIGKQADVIFFNTTKRAIAAQRLLDVQKELNDVQSKGAKDVDQSEFSYAAQGAEVQILQGKIKGLSTEIAGYDKALKNANTSAYNATVVQDQLIKQFGVTPFVSGLEKDLEAQAKALEDAGKKATEYRRRLKELHDQQVLNGLNQGQRLAESIDRAGKDFVKSLKAKDAADGIDKLIDKTKELHDAEIKGSGQTIGPLAHIFDAEIDAALAALNKFNDSASSIIQNSIVDTFGGLGEAIGNSLSGAGNILSNLSQTLLATLGNTLTNLGKLAIATGVGIQAIKTALKTLNPAVAIGAGIALVALGTAISKSVAKLGDVPGFANGVENFKGGLAVVGERGPELVNLPRGSGVIPNHRIANVGNDSYGFVASTKIQGQDLFVLVEKVKKNLGLLG